MAPGTCRRCFNELSLGSSVEGDSDIVAHIQWRCILYERFQSGGDVGVARVMSLRWAPRSLSAVAVVEQHGAEWVDMSQRIEGDASKLPSGVITKGMRDVAMPPRAKLLPEGPGSPRLRQRRCLDRITGSFSLLTGGYMRLASIC